MIQRMVGFRELRARLSHYLDQVKAGNTLVITERGKPVAIIVPVRAFLEIRMQEMMQAGFLVWNGQKFAPQNPIARTGGNRTVADLLLEDRT
jgi:prevent-host-death family protein